MSNIVKEVSTVFGAAFNDTLINIFRPIHNAKVILGLEREPSIVDKIKKYKELAKIFAGLEQNSRSSQESEKNKPKSQEDHSRKIVAGA